MTTRLTDMANSSVHSSVRPLTIDGACGGYHSSASSVMVKLCVRSLIRAPLLRVNEQRSRIFYVYPATTEYPPG